MGKTKATHQNRHLRRPGPGCAGIDTACAIMAHTGPGRPNGGYDTQAVCLEYWWGIPIALPSLQMAPRYLYMPLTKVVGVAACSGSLAGVIFQAFLSVGSMLAGLCIGLFTLLVLAHIAQLATESIQQGEDLPLEAELARRGYSLARQDQEIRIFTPTRQTRRILPLDVWVKITDRSIELRGPQIVISQIAEGFSRSDMAA